MEVREENAKEDRGNAPVTDERYVDSDGREYQDCGVMSVLTCH